MAWIEPLRKAAREKVAKQAPEISRRIAFEQERKEKPPTSEDVEKFLLPILGILYGFATELTVYDHYEIDLSAPDLIAVLSQDRVSQRPLSEYSLSRSQTDEAHDAKGIVDYAYGMRWVAKRNLEQGGSETIEFKLLPIISAVDGNQLGRVEIVITARNSRKAEDVHSFKGVVDMDLDLEDSLHQHLMESVLQLEVVSETHNMETALRQRQET